MPCHAACCSRAYLFAHARCILLLCHDASALCAMRMRVASYVLRAARALRDARCCALTRGGVAADIDACARRKRCLPYADDAFAMRCWWCCLMRAIRYLRVSHYWFLPDYYLPCLFLMLPPPFHFPLFAVFWCLFRRHIIFHCWCWYLRLFSPFSCHLCLPAFAAFIAIILSFLMLLIMLLPLMMLPRLFWLFSATPGFTLRWWWLFAMSSPRHAIYYVAPCCFSIRHAAIIILPFWLFCRYFFFFRYYFDASHFPLPFWYSDFYAYFIIFAITPFRSPMFFDIFRFDIFSMLIFIDIFIISCFFMLMSLFRCLLLILLFIIIFIIDIDYFIIDIIFITFSLLPTLIIDWLFRLRHAFHYYAAAMPIIFRFRLRHTLRFLHFYAFDVIISLPCADYATLFSILMPSLSDAFLFIRLFRLHSLFIIDVFMMPPDCRVLFTIFTPCLRRFDYLMLITPSMPLSCHASIIFDAAYWLMPSHAWFLPPDTLPFDADIRVTLILMLIMLLLRWWWFHAMLMICCRLSLDYFADYYCFFICLFAATLHYYFFDVIFFPDYFVISLCCLLTDISLLSPLIDVFRHVFIFRRFACWYFSLLFFFDAAHYFHDILIILLAISFDFRFHYYFSFIIFFRHAIFALFITPLLLMPMPAFFIILLPDVYAWCFFDVFMILRHACRLFDAILLPFSLMLPYWLFSYYATDYFCHFHFFLRCSFHWCFHYYAFLLRWFFLFLFFWYYCWLFLRFIFADAFHITMLMLIFSYYLPISLRHFRCFDYFSPLISMIFSSSLPAAFFVLIIISLLMPLFFADGLLLWCCCRWLLSPFRRLSPLWYFFRWRSHIDTPSFRLFYAIDAFSAVILIIDILLMSLFFFHFTTMLMPCYAAARCHVSLPPRLPPCCRYMMPRHACRYFDDISRHFDAAILIILFIIFADAAAIALFFALPRLLLATMLLMPMPFSFSMMPDTLRYDAPAFAAMMLPPPATPWCRMFWYALFDIRDMMLIYAALPLCFSSRCRLMLPPCRRPLFFDAFHAILCCHCLSATMMLLTFYSCDMLLLLPRYFIIFAIDIDAAFLLRHTMPYWCCRLFSSLLLFDAAMPCCPSPMICRCCRFWCPRYAPDYTRWYFFFFFSMLILMFTISLPIYDACYFIPLLILIIYAAWWCSFSLRFRLHCFAIFHFRCFFFAFFRYFFRCLITPSIRLPPSDFAILWYYFLFFPDYSSFISFHFDCFLLFRRHDTLFHLMLIHTDAAALRRHFLATSLILLAFRAWFLFAVDVDFALPLFFAFRCCWCPAAACWCHDMRTLFFIIDADYFFFFWLLMMISIFFLLMPDFSSPDYFSPDIFWLFFSISFWFRLLFHCAILIWCFISRLWLLCWCCRPAMPLFDTDDYYCHAYLPLMICCYAWCHERSMLLADARCWCRRRADFFAYCYYAFISLFSLRWFSLLITLRYLPLISFHSPPPCFTIHVYRLRPPCFAADVFRFRWLRLLFRLILLIFLFIIYCCCCLRCYCWLLMLDRYVFPLLFRFFAIILFRCRAITLITPLFFRHFFFFHYIISMLLIIFSSPSFFDIADWYYYADILMIRLISLFCFAIDIIFWLFHWWLFHFPFDAISLCNFADAMPLIDCFFAADTVWWCRFYADALFITFADYTLMLMLIIFAMMLFILVLRWCFLPRLMPSMIFSIDYCRAIRFSWCRFDIFHWYFWYAATNAAADMFSPLISIRRDYFDIFRFSPFIIFADAISIIFTIRHYRYFSLFFFFFFFLFFVWLFSLILFSISVAASATDYAFFFRRCFTLIISFFIDYFCRYYFSMLIDAYYFICSYFYSLFHVFDDIFFLLYYYYYAITLPLIFSIFLWLFLSLFIFFFFHYCWCPAFFFFFFSPFRSFSLLLFIILFCLRWFCLLLLSILPRFFFDYWYFDVAVFDIFPLCWLFLSLHCHDVSLLSRIVTLVAYDAAVLMFT